MVTSSDPSRQGSSSRPASGPVPAEPRDLDVVQRWFQSVITHPAGVGDGIESPEAQASIPIAGHELETVVLPSKKLSAHDRLAVYANAYYARLLDCLGESFPVLKRTVGEEIFNDFAFGYLQRYPSRSYTLNRLGDDFARYLEETRPDRDQAGRPPETPSWVDLLIGLAELEWTIAEVFDGPGVENTALLGSEQLLAVPHERWPHSHIVLAVCLRLLRFPHAVNAFYTRARRAEENEEVPLPEPVEQFLAITRRDYVVRRYELSQPQYVLLSALEAGETIGDAIRRGTDATDLDSDAFAERLRGWFKSWTQEGFFQEII